MKACLYSLCLLFLVQAAEQNINDEIPKEVRDEIEEQLNNPTPSARQLQEHAYAEKLEAQLKSFDSHSPNLYCESKDVPKYKSDVEDRLASMLEIKLLEDSKSDKIDDTASAVLHDDGGYAPLIPKAIENVAKHDSGLAVSLSLTLGLGKFTDAMYIAAVNYSEAADRLVVSLKTEATMIKEIEEIKEQLAKADRKRVALNKKHFLVKEGFSKGCLISAPDDREEINEQLAHQMKEDALQHDDDMIALIEYEAILEQSAQLAKLQAKIASRHRAILKKAFWSDKALMVGVVSGLPIDTACTIKLFPISSGFESQLLRDATDFAILTLPSRTCSQILNKDDAQLLVKLGSPTSKPGLFYIQHEDYASCSFDGLDLPSLIFKGDRDTYVSPRGRLLLRSYIKSAFLTALAYGHEQIIFDLSGFEAAGLLKNHFKDMVKIYNTYFARIQPNEQIEAIFFVQECDEPAAINRLW